MHAPRDVSGRELFVTKFYLDEGVDQKNGDHIPLAQFIVPCALRHIIDANSLRVW